MPEISDSLTYSCAHCGRSNRILRAKLYDGPRCGACKGNVFPDRPVAVSDGTWTHEVEDCPIPVLVDFWAPWCAPCRTIAPALAQLASARAGRLKIAKLNVDENPIVAGRFQVRSIPLLVLFRGPLVLDQLAGAVPVVALEGWLDRAL